MLEVVKFYATWCGPCQVLAPEFDKVKGTIPGVKFTEIDVDNDENGLAAKHGIMGVPSVLFIKDEKVVDKFVGFRPANQIEDMVKRHF